MSVAFALIVFGEGKGFKLLPQTRKTTKRKSPGTVQGLVAGWEWQERQDSNPRPLVLETSALARLSYAPAYP